jgi:hypothetical protein
MFSLNQRVQISNHSEPECNGQYGTVVLVELAFNGNAYYTVELDDSHSVCVCTSDELMEE